MGSFFYWVSFGSVSGQTRGIRGVKVVDFDGFDFYFFKILKRAKRRNRFWGGECNFGFWEEIGLNGVGDDKRNIP